jgi:hypothetical protein
MFDPDKLRRPSGAYGSARITGFKTRRADRALKPALNLRAVDFFLDKGCGFFNLCIRIKNELKIKGEFDAGLSKADGGY